MGMHADGGGLYLQVTKTVSGQPNKSWLFRYSVGGRERQMGLGPLSEIKLAAARERATECRLQRLAGIDPIEERERARRVTDASSITFQRAFETFFASKRKSLSNEKHAAQWQSTMESYVFPSIGSRPVGEIEAREILDLLTPIWFAKAETARRVLQRMEAVFTVSQQSCGATGSEYRPVSASKRNWARGIKRRSTIVLCLIRGYPRSSPIYALAILNRPLG